jgi:hypothetical protein
MTGLKIGGRVVHVLKDAQAPPAVSLPGLSLPRGADDGRGPVPTGRRSPPRTTGQKPPLSPVEVLLLDVPLSLELVDVLLEVLSPSLEVLDVLLPSLEVVEPPP